MNTMTYKGYTAAMTFDAEDKIIVGRVQDIDDIITFDAVSVGEFEQMGGEGFGSRGAWLASARDPLRTLNNLGRYVSQNKRSQLLKQ